MSEKRPVLALSGGVGGARLVHGLAAALPADALTVAVNTGDDFVHWGLTVCPDLDTIMYTLSDLADVSRGWGLAEESFGALAMVERYGGPAWFKLGDRDLGTHLTRSQWLNEGRSLTEVTERLCRALGIGPRVVPMADEARPTYIVTADARTLPFQDWFVRERCAPAIIDVEYRGTRTPAPAMMAAIAHARLIVICPSNPYVSIDPILTLDGVVEAMAGKPVIAVSPIVHGRAVKGPLAEMMPALSPALSGAGDSGRDRSTDRGASAAAILGHYRARHERRGLHLAGFLVAPGDEAAIAQVASASSERDTKILATDIIMTNVAERERLAREVLAFAETLP